MYAAITHGSSSTVQGNPRRSRRIRHNNTKRHIEHSHRCLCQIQNNDTQQAMIMWFVHCFRTYSLVPEIKQGQQKFQRWRGVKSSILSTPDNSFGMTEADDTMATKKSTMSQRQAIVRTNAGPTPGEF